MINLFILFMNMSISASWLILAVLLFRIFLNKVPKSLTVFLWGLIFIRCILFYSFESIFCIIPSTQTVPKDIISSVIPYIQSNITFIDTTVNSILYENAVYNSNSMFSSVELYISVYTFIWILGIIILGSSYIYSFFSLKEKVKLSLYYKDQIYYCEEIESPFVFGIKNPKIYLPIGIEEQHIKYVLMHERLHIKRKDYIWKCIGILLLILYWFNPLMWVAYILFNKDIEMSIDELVTKNMNAQEKKEYCESLISLSDKENHYLFHTLAFGEINIKHRIKNIIKYRKPGTRKYVLIVVSCIILVFTCMSNPVQSNDSLQGITIAEIADWDNYSTIFENVKKLEIGNEENSYTTIFLEDVESVLETLSEIRIMKNPISQSRSVERDKSHYLILQSETKINIYFNHDLSELWISRNGKPSLSYEILNHEKLYTIFNQFEFQRSNLDYIDGKVVDVKEDCWIVNSLSNETIVYEIEKLQSYSDLKIGNHIRIFYNKTDNDSVLKKNDIKSVFHVNGVEIVKVIKDSLSYKSKEIENAMDKIIANTPQLKEYSYVELYYDENKALQFMNEHSLDKANTIVIFANLKASTSIMEGMSKGNGSANFVVGPNIYMSFFNIN